MPFESERQRRFMYKRHPKIARRWSHKYGDTPMDKVKGARKRRRKQRGE
jgi:hypothetical protein